jgi:hypothetical protein
MSTLPLAIIFAERATAEQARNALPGAPVIPVTEPEPQQARRPRVARPRAVMARQLERAARAVAPTPAP